MASSFAFFRLAAPVCLALAAGLSATAPAAAQYLGPWGGGWGGPFGPPPARMYGPGPGPDVVDEDRIPPRAVAGILRAQGYRLVAPPRMSGVSLIALGENADGQRARFVIDAYDGDVLQMRPAGGGVAVGRNVPPANLALGAPVELDDAPPVGGRLDSGRMGAGGLPDPLLDRLPNAQKPQHVAPKARTASHAPAERGLQAQPKKAAVPSQATRIPKSPIQQAAPAAPAPTPAPVNAAVAPDAGATPLAPDARPTASPADIGPRVQPVEARAPSAPVTAPAPSPVVIAPETPAAPPPASHAPDPDLTP